MKTFLLRKAGSSGVLCRQAVDDLAQGVLASTEGEFRLNLASGGLRIAMVVRLLDGVRRCHRILRRDVITGVANQGRDPRHTGPDRNASARHGFTERVWQAFVGRSLDVHPGSPVLLKKLRL